MYHTSRLNTYALQYIKGTRHEDMSSSVATFGPTGKYDCGCLTLARINCVSSCRNVSVIRSRSLLFSATTDLVGLEIPIAKHCSRLLLKPKARHSLLPSTSTLIRPLALLCFIWAPPRLHPTRTGMGGERRMAGVACATPTLSEPNQHFDLLSLPAIPIAHCITLWPHQLRNMTLHPCAQVTFSTF